VNVRSNAVLGVSFSLSAIAMLFIGLTSAYVVRRGLDPQWSPVPVPNAMVAACVCLLASSVTLQYGHRGITAILGAGFITGQILACRELFEGGFYLSTNPHSSFVYLFTALHAMHVIGGIVALSMRARPDAVALYWHGMAVLWTYLLVVLFVWK
jgi:cytochrome c oxidase subunit III